MICVISVICNIYFPYSGEADDEISEVSAPHYVVEVHQISVPHQVAVLHRVAVLHQVAALHQVAELDQVAELHQVAALHQVAHLCDIYLEMFTILIKILTYWF